ncbi:tetratricopeptide repeat protein [Herbiconiux sp. YIM B11900]|uniref:tetratricopeptide repeat protein n=1 Tax=Herbiconiux sp. YIM B11900 TaxID=3404131 RepID=UPI003F865D7C
MSTADTTTPRPDADGWENLVASLWANPELSDDDRLERMRDLANQAPHPALAAFELGGALDSSGHEAEADVQYAAATAAGLASVDPARAAQLTIQHASTLRNLGRIEEAIGMLRTATAHPAVGRAPAVFLALALHSAGRTDEALRVAIEAIEPSLPRYHRSVRGYAAALTEARTSEAGDTVRG